MVAGLMFLARAAWADGVGYVCTLSYLPSPDYGYGNYGYIQVELTTGTNCSGDFSNYSLFTVGSTLYPDTRYLYTEAGIMNAHSSLLSAQQNNMKTQLRSAADNQVYAVVFWKN
jgi:hypothetical protein